MNPETELEPGAAGLMVAYASRRSRLTLFAVILALPQSLALIVLGLPAVVLIVLAWFALLISARWPPSAFEFLGGFLRFATRHYAYVSLLTDRYPPWRLADVSEYPIRLLIGSPQQRYSRVKAGLRIFYVLPAYFGAVAGGALVQLVMFATWITILVKGRQPKELFEVQRLGLGWVVQFGLLENLLTENYDWALEATPTASTH